MKKIYILAIAAFGFAFTANAQLVDDNMEDYVEGPISAQGPVWRAWSGVDGGADDGDVVTDFANSPVNSLNIPGDEVTDQLLLIPGSPSTGTYTVQFSLLIPEGSSFYFNMQAALTPEGTAWNQALMGGNVYFNCSGSDEGNGGVTGVIDCSAFDFTFTYPEEEFFTVTNVYNLDAQTWAMSINGTEQFNGAPFEFGTQVFEGLSAIDFFSASATNDGYIDDVLVVEGTLGSEDFSSDVFSVYPNPVKDILNIKSATPVDSVVVYDILGKVVSQSTSKTVDMSGLSSGAYLVKVTIGDTSKTVKVIK